MSQGPKQQVAAVVPATWTSVREVARRAGLPVRETHDAVLELVDEGKAQRMWWDGVVKVRRPRAAPVRSLPYGRLVERVAELIRARPRTVQEVAAELNVRKKSARDAVHYLRRLGRLDMTIIRRRTGRYSWREQQGGEGGGSFSVENTQPATVSEKFGPQKEARARRSLRAPKHRREAPEDDQ